MTKTYTITEAIYYLHVDPKTFQKWLTKANIDLSGQISRADNRVRYLTSEQLTQLAEDHGRVLDFSHPVPTEKPTAQQGQMKLLNDRLHVQERLVSDHDEQIKEYADTSRAMGKMLDDLQAHIASQDDAMILAKKNVTELEKSIQLEIKQLIQRSQEQGESLERLVASQIELHAVQVQENERLTHQLASMEEQHGQEREQLTEQLREMKEQLAVLVIEIARLKEMPKRVRRPKVSKVTTEESSKENTPAHDLESEKP